MVGGGADGVEDDDGDADIEFDVWGAGVAGLGVTSDTAVAMGDGLADGRGVGVGVGATMIVPPGSVAFCATKVTDQVPGVPTLLDPVQRPLPSGGPFSGTMIPAPGRVSRALTLFGSPDAVTENVNMVAVVPVRGLTLPLARIGLATTGVATAAKSSTSRSAEAETRLERHRSSIRGEEDVGHIWGELWGVGEHEACLRLLQAQ
jgi:hypothetical protein